MHHYNYRKIIIAWNMLFSLVLIFIKNSETEVYGRMNQFMQSDNDPEDSSV